MVAALSLRPRIRLMRLTDLPSVLRVEQACYNFPWSLAIFEDCLRVGYCCLVQEHEAQVRGYLIMSVAAGECHVLNLCVQPSARGHGLAYGLLKRGLRLARQLGADTAFLEVRLSNQAAISLYQRCLFAEVGMRRNYYPALVGREDALVMARSLTSALTDEP